MKKIVYINSCNFGSTGGIMYALSDTAEANGYETYCAVANSRSNKIKKTDNTVYIGSVLERNIHLILSKITGYNGCFSHFGTYAFLKKLDKIKPDIIHLHNLHNCYINLPMLFKYIKKHNIKTIWTLHDCWAFTGQCPHFQIADCSKWQTGCFDCPQYKSYPASITDKTQTMYMLKKKWVSGVKDLTIITPSEWLASLVKESYLKDYPVKVINNGIDLNIFKPTESDFRKRYSCEDKFVILGVASPWSERKGLDVFIDLSKKLDDIYQIVLVGLSEKQIEEIPQNIIGIGRTQNQTELVKIYSAADVFVNPTREDNFPTVNIEALACGLPVITYNTGGSAECINENCGLVVKSNTANELIDILCGSDCKNISKQSCLFAAKQYDMHNKFEKYIEQYGGGF